MPDPPHAAAGDAMPDEAEYLELCARLLRVDASALSLETAREDVVSWDSISHLRLVMESESLFGRELALERIPEIRTLGELYASFQERRGGVVPEVP